MDDNMHRSKRTKYDNSNQSEEERETEEAEPDTSTEPTIPVADSSSDDVPFVRRRIRNRNYRRSSNTSSDSDDPNDPIDVAREAWDRADREIDRANAASTSNSGNDNENHEENDLIVTDNDDSSSSSSLSDDSSEDYSPINSDYIGSDNAYDSDELEMPYVETDILKNKWQGFKEIQQRTMNCSTSKHLKYNQYSFQKRFYGSLYAVQNLSLLHKLDQVHEGCVNSLNFNHSGKLLVSGSDDLKVIIWDWKLKKVLHTIDSGHKSNVFQTKFIEDATDNGTLNIISTGRDGQVRLLHVRNCGETETSLLFKMNQSVHKIAISPNNPKEILAAGEDGCVRRFDLRSQSGSKLVKIKKRLYSIATHSFGNEFCISGNDKFVRVYDFRNTKKPLKELYPESLGVNENGYQTVTCCVYNETGTEILASYGDQDIFLFDNSPSSSATKVLHKYSGHCNSKTIKGVNFFGQNSEYVVSGSDCGHIYFWDKETEIIAKWMKGDDTGVVNCLEPHPVFPILASSGLDSDVKIWVPTGRNDEKETVYTKENLEKNVKRNLKMLRHPEENIFDDRILDFFIYHRLRNARRRRFMSQGFSSSDSNDNDNDDADGLDPTNRRGLLQCNPM